MEIIKFDRIVSVNSEIQGHGAQNILDGEIAPNKNWMCEKGTEKAVVILQMERAAILTSIHVGNAHSAFVEILVGKAADSTDLFQSLVPMSSFMNPNESKTGTNPNRTRFFGKDDFNEETKNKSWDRIKVVCSQPFNKYVPYGLCFLKVHGEKEAKKDGKEDEIQVGSFFKKRKTLAAAEKTLSVSEQIKAAEKDSTPLSIAKISEKMSEKKHKPKTGDEKKETKAKPSGSKESEKKEEKKTPAKKKEKTTKREHENDDNKTRKRVKEEDKTPRKKRLKKPFERLMEDVVLVISGFKNPLRGDIRTMVLEMGGRYSADWESHCTHLVCAYDNTPKFHQVKGKGKIVRKEWVERCHKDRKRYPWRRFALDKTDLKKPESEEEIDAGDESEPEPEDQSGTTAGTSAEPESQRRSSLVAQPLVGSDYEMATDEDEEEKEKTVDTTDYPMPYLPNIFSEKSFFLDPNLQNKAVLERYIVAYNGKLTETFSSEVDFYVTDKGAPVELLRKKSPDLTVIKPSWIWEINEKQKYVSPTSHILK